MSIVQYVIVGVLLFFILTGLGTLVVEILTRCIGSSWC